MRTSEAAEYEASTCWNWSVAEKNIISNYDYIVFFSLPLFSKCSCVFFAQQFFSRQQISSSHVIYYFRILWIIFIRDSISHLRPISSRISTEFSVSVPTHISYSSRSLDKICLFIRNRISLQISGCRVLRCKRRTAKSQKMEMIFISNCVRVKARIYSVSFFVPMLSATVFSFKAKHERWATVVSCVGPDRARKSKDFPKIYTITTQFFPFFFLASMVLGKK